jgi:HEAT repeat protein
MSTTQVPTPEMHASADGEAHEPPFSPALAEEVVKRFAKTLRTRSLYLPNNPVYQGAIDGLREALGAVWAVADQLTVTITETELRWENRALMSEPSRQEGLPWLVFKDGLRELTFVAGVEGDELEQLLDILVRARKAAPEEDDLLTLLWEREFLYLRYRFVDLSFDNAGIEVPAGAGEESRNVGDPQETVEEESPSRNFVSIQDLDSSLYFLEEHEIEYLRAEVAKEYQTGQHKSAIAAIFDIFDTQEDEAIRSEISGIAETLVPQLLSMGEYGAVAFLLREAREVISRTPELPAKLRESLSTPAARLSGVNVLPQLIQALDESQNIPPQSDLEALFAELKGETLATILAAIPDTQTPSLRVALEAAGARLASVNTAELVRLILSANRHVALQAIRRAGELATPAAVGPLGKVLGEHELELRQAAALALATIGSPGAMRVLEPAFDDSDRDIRITVARAIAAKSYRAALPRVEAIIRGRAVRAADLTERMAVFEAYAALAGADGIELLSRLLSPRGFFSRKVDPEFRACAAMALGRIGTPEAIAQLRAAVNDKDVLVRSSINKALRGSG